MMAYHVTSRLFEALVPFSPPLFILLLILIPPMEQDSDFNADVYPVATFSRPARNKSLLKRAEHGRYILPAVDGRTGAQFET
jgi:hypothetical protein